MNAWIHRLAELLSRGRVVRRRLPQDLGGHRLFVTPGAALRYWKRNLGDTERALLDLVREFVAPGMVVWDIGANVGVFALSAAYRSGPAGWIGAVEPQAWLAGLIRRSAACAPASHARVEVLTAAVASRPGAALLAVANRGLAASHLTDVEGSSQAGGTRSVVEVSAVRLDDLLDIWPPPDLLKIDVEGAEAICLAGGRALLSRRPTLLCEVTSENARSVAAILKDANYTIFDAAVSPARRSPLEYAVWNTLAVPQ